MTKINGNGPVHFITIVLKQQPQMLPYLVLQLGLYYLRGRVSSHCHIEIPFYLEVAANDIILS